MMDDAALCRLSARAARAAIRSGEITALALVRACLGRIAERDKEVRAWISLNPEAEAEAAAISADDPRPLAGIPIAIKDMIATRDLPTSYNSPLFGGHHTGADAACVATLRAAGAIILGKTDTTEFAACGRDAATGNPADPDRTPGGSSAGSAAAVADFHVPLALGTQTGGSTIRPASFCGDVALKPSWGLISTEGVGRYAVSFDTVGLIARAVEDLALLAEVYALPASPSLPGRRLRLGITRTPFAALLEPETRALFDALPERLAPVAEVAPFALPDGFEEADDLHRCVQMCEGANAFLHLARSRRALLHRDFHDRVEMKMGFAPQDQFAARDRLAALRMALERALQPVDAIIAPSAPGFAPLGRAPGNPKFNALWTAVQVPVLGLPVSGTDLPLGLSLIAPRGADRRLLEIAARLAPAL
ncbi:amidase [Poseidonocella sedimentorum]|uniref:Asp-tRNAAsn/Glu-tRNAGln amidotransferase A subunit n=1 Tax=Poseidonocella sedimentorum TaxID=871652 RepID=A0A1I6E3C7_9RHOB|nr:amidase [Poseidonocella sedimentorum]SFR12223.1 Asp-tRNAAsn/Glu-tRNAGln amidotransferase A subunit [Poseidonocella sedimentorum]